MTTNKLLEIIKERGMFIELDENGQPHLRNGGSTKGATDELLAVLPFHRLEIIRRLTPGPKLYKTG